jgi:hypothetical protein
VVGFYSLEPCTNRWIGMVYYHHANVIRPIKFCLFKDSLFKTIITSDLPKDHAIITKRFSVIDLREDVS